MTMKPTTTTTTTMGSIRQLVLLLVIAVAVKSGSISSSSINYPIQHVEGLNLTPRPSAGGRMKTLWSKVTSTTTSRLSPTSTTLSPSSSLSTQSLSSSTSSTPPPLSSSLSKDLHQKYTALTPRPAAAIDTAITGADDKDGCDDTTTNPSVVIPGRGIIQTKTQQLIHMIRGGNIKAQNFLQNHPFASAVIITTVNAVCADLMTQLVLERSAAAATAGAAVWNWQRTLLFGAFGFVFQGFCQYAIVNWGWEKLCPGTSPRAVAMKVCGMNLISDPMFFFPAFYLFKQILVLQAGGVGAGVAVEGAGRFAALSSFVSSALTSYRQNAWQDWKNSWMVWFPGHAVTYGVMPQHKRIPWMAFLSFFYMCVLSLTRGGA